MRRHHDLSMTIYWNVTFVARQPSANRHLYAAAKVNSRLPVSPY